jgi:Tfp pilus assembly protein PilO
MKQSSKRLVSVFLAFLFVLAAFISFFDLVQPTYNDMTALRSKQLGEENYIQSQTALVKQVQTILTTYETEAQGAGNVGLAMPSGEDVAGALAQIQGIAANNGIAIGNIAVTPPAIQINAATGIAAASSSSGLLKPLGSFNFKLTASGSYESFKNFLSEIETNIRIFNVEAVSLQPIAAAPSASGKAVLSNDMFNYIVTIATYYQTQ